jgi:hypothetical protein
MHLFIVNAATEDGYNCSSKGTLSGKPSPTQRQALCWCRADRRTDGSGARIQLCCHDSRQRCLTATQETRLETLTVAQLPALYQNRSHCSPAGVPVVGNTN